jgi:methylenetetrahydrofolate reductase (NADPH)
VSEAVAARAPGGPRREEAGGRLARILQAGRFAVTGEVVPPRSADAERVRSQARELVGYVDAANVLDNPVASAHMANLAATAFVAEAGIEPTLQLTVRDRNRLAVTAELLGAWALGARNLLCLTGDPMSAGDEPEAAAVEDLSVLDLVGTAAALRDEGRLPSGRILQDPPRFLVGVADVPLSEPYDVGRLEAKLDAGADFVMTQAVYDLEGIEAWADLAGRRGVLERAQVIVGVIPLRTAAAARRMEATLPGVRVPPTMLSALEAAGPEAPEVGIELTVDVVRGLRAIRGLAGVHVMGMGLAEPVRRVIGDAGLLPRPTGG